MSSPKYAVPLYLKRYPSPTLAVYLASIHGGVLMLLPWLALPWELVVGLSIAIFTSFYFTLRNHVLLSSPKAIIQILWDDQGVWFLRQRDGIEYVGKLLSGCFVGSRVVVLSFSRGFWRRIGIVLLPDNLDPEVLRRLRVRLCLTHS